MDAGAAAAREPPKSPNFVPPVHFVLARNYCKLKTISEWSEMARAIGPETGLGQGFPQAARLAGFRRVATSDVDEAAEQVGRIFCPHRLTPLHSTALDFHALHNCADFDGFSVNYVSYGGSASADPGRPLRLFLPSLPRPGF